MATKEMGEILNAIGQRIAVDLGKIPDDVFAFLEAGDQWCGGAIFENLENEVVYHEISVEIEDLILSLWQAAEPDKKWSILLMDVKDGHFGTEFMYTDDLEHHPFEHDYREDALVARYGDKPVIYPEPEAGDWHDVTEADLA